MHCLVNSTFFAKSRTTTLGPFGEVIRATGPLAKANPIRFSTKYEDDESDLFYYGYRYAKDGRWLSRDPYDEPGFQTASAWQAYLRPRYDSFDSDADMDVEQSTDSWQNPGNAYQLCFGNVISKWDLWGLVPQGSTFFPVYLDYNKYPKEEQVWTFIGGTHGPEHIGQNSCAARVSAALNRIPNEHITGRADFINSVPPTGIAGRFIVNAKSMNGYLKKKWGTDSTCSKTAAYYFKSKTNRGDFQGLLGEILAVTIKCKCGGGGFVAVVSSVVNETGVSGHVGVVTPTYHDHYTPYGDSIDVWILPSTL